MGELVAYWAILPCSDRFAPYRAVSDINIKLAREFPKQLPFGTTF